MKHAKVWISIGVLVLVGVVIGINRSKPRVDTELPPPAASLAGPQEPVPTTAYNPTTPLTKNNVLYKNGMKIEITKEGTGPEIANGDTAVVSYVGKLENGTVFDASKNHGDGSFAFALGAGQVIKGWDQGVLGMKAGEVRVLTIPSDLAYGPSGVPGVIPPNATLVFEVTLLSIK